MAAHKSENAFYLYTLQAVDLISLLFGDLSYETTRASSSTASRNRAAACVLRQLGIHMNV